jgi:hypothetical protein
MRRGYPIGKGRKQERGTTELLALKRRGSFVNMSPEMAEWVGIAVTALLSVAALYYGQSLRRRMSAEVAAKVADKRFDAYAALWQEMKIASPMRTTPLTAGERSKLFQDLTDWYYNKGHGMLLTERTRNIYLTAKRNLTCPVEKLEPASFKEQVALEGDTARSSRSIRQLSLLRTSMRADVEIYTQPYEEELSPDDIEFLRACKVDLDRPPWRDAIRREA